MQAAKALRTSIVWVTKEDKGLGMESARTFLCVLCLCLSPDGEETPDKASSFSG